MDQIKRYAPTKFLGRYSLQNGAKIVGSVMCVVSLFCLLFFLIDYFRYKNDDKCMTSVLHDVYSFCWNAIFYCACMFCAHLWFILWGVNKRKSSVVLAWVVITSIWWLQSVCFVVIMLLVNITDIGFQWIIGLCFGIIAFVFFAYCILTGYGFWLEIKNVATILIMDESSKTLLTARRLTKKSTCHTINLHSYKIFAITAFFEMLQVSDG